MSELEPVTIILTDRPITTQPTFQYLKFKFESQQFGKLLWFVRMEKSYEYFPIEYAKDKSFIIENMKNNPQMVYEMIDPMLKLDVDIALEYLLWTDRVDSKQVLALENTMNDTKFVANFLKSHAHLLEEDILNRLMTYYPSMRAVFDDKKHFLEIVKFEGLVEKNVLLLLELATEKVRSDRLIIEECVKYNGFSLNFANNDLKNDREMILKAVRVDGLVLRDLEKRWSTDRDIVIEAVKRNGNIIAKTPSEFRLDREIVFLALKSNSMCLEYLSGEMKNDREIVLLAVRCDKPLVSGQSCLRYASDLLKCDREVILEAVKHNPYSGGVANTWISLMFGISLSTLSIDLPHILTNIATNITSQTIKLHDDNLLTHPLLNTNLTHVFKTTK
ncbi:predicted protein [Naegleria gruberi]|uniref:Predicted protein n=1 Tax=Naegleria gruberi TaxID=5762 RepID=D2W205_NAEGR|nr:uncharacterized protein NAEGRDRAFT_75414 [Naegleria gruberi]EFC36905.1 predicted protein [Naegleria gruberi]|eukprot:XP_002669649.1 predicted protein [Naegleria gruberi strain NEG-M]